MAEPRRRWRVWHFIAIGVVGVGVLAGGIIALVLSLTQPVVTASDSFMTALKDGNFQAAYSMGTPDLRTELGSPERLGAMFARARPQAWSWSSRMIKNGTGTVSGTVTFSGGAESDGAIYLLPEGDDWRIAGFQMNPRGS